MTYYIVSDSNELILLRVKTRLQLTLLSTTLYCYYKYHYICISMKQFYVNQNVVTNSLCGYLDSG